MESLRKRVGSTPMSGNQVIGYDRNNDGIVDDDSSVVS